MFSLLEFFLPDNETGVETGVDGLALVVESGHTATDDGGDTLERTKRKLINNASLKTLSSERGNLIVNPLKSLGVLNYASSWWKQNTNDLRNKFNWLDQKYVTDFLSSVRDTLSSDRVAPLCPSISDNKV